MKIFTLKFYENFAPTKASKTASPKGGAVALQPEFQSDKIQNQAGDPPSKTSTGPTGAPKRPAGGVS